jgi:hypothetical protein
MGGAPEKKKKNESSDVFTCTYSSPPGGMNFFAQNGKRLYEEAGGDGVNPVIHPDFPKHFIYPSGKGWSFINEDRKDQIRQVVDDLDYAKSMCDKKAMLECKKRLEELGIHFFKWDI